MPTFMLILKIGLYLIPLIFGTHFIRTAAFNHYEAVTYECSFTAILLAALSIVRQGGSLRFCALAVVFLLGFIGNAMVQGHFYKALQRRIGETFAQKTGGPNGLDGEKRETLGELQALASISIMPSFSRFIEESKLFNNQGSFIGLLKSLMKRQRFQKKKYLMRECFADNANMIGFSMPVIRRAYAEESELSGGEAGTKLLRVMEASDLALVDRDEKIGLISFDVLGFGALIGIWAVLLYRCALPGAATRGTGLAAAAVLLALSLLSYRLRGIAFGRCESFAYELSFSALVGVSFYVFEELLSGAALSPAQWLAAALVPALFAAASVINRLADNKAHKEINEKISRIIDAIRPDSELNRTRRRFLNNLRLVSEWAVVPAVKSWARKDEAQTAADGMGKLIRRVAPECVTEDAAGFAIPAEKKRFAQGAMIVAGCLSLAAAVCLWSGIL